MELLGITCILHKKNISSTKKRHLPDPLVFVGGLANLTTPNTLTVVLACNSLSFRYLYSVVFVFFSVIASFTIKDGAKICFCLYIDPEWFFGVFFNVICCYLTKEIIDSIIIVFYARQIKNNKITNTDIF